MRYTTRHHVTSIRLITGNYAIEPTPAQLRKQHLQSAMHAHQTHISDHVKKIGMHYRPLPLPKKDDHL